MSEQRLPVPGLDLQSELTTTAVPVAAGGAATFSASNNIATITFNGNHSLTLSPSAGTMPNYFITFGGSTSGLTGTGVLVGNIFRILDIPSATAIKIYTTITAATVTSLTGIPVFFPPFTAGIGSSFTNGPTQEISTAGTYPLPNLAGATVYTVTGANAALRYNPDQTAVILDASTGNTPATAPTWRDVIPVSSQGSVFGAPPWFALWANGSAGTTRASVLA